MSTAKQVLTTRKPADASAWLDRIEARPEAIDLTKPGHVSALLVCLGLDGTRARARTRLLAVPDFGVPVVRALERS